MIDMGGRSADDAEGAKFKPTPADVAAARLVGSQIEMITTGARPAPVFFVPRGPCLC